jgi:hypothetical protein
MLQIKYRSVILLVHLGGLILNITSSARKNICFETQIFPTAKINKKVHEEIKFSTLHEDKKI